MSILFFFDINGIAFNFAMMYDVFCELFVDSLKKIILQSFWMFWWNFLHDKEMLNYALMFFIHLLRCVCEMWDLAASVTGRTCSLGKGMQESRMLLPASLFPVSSPRLRLPEQPALKLSKVRASSDVDNSWTAPCWLRRFCWVCIIVWNFPLCPSPAFLSSFYRPLIPNKWSISQTQSQCLLWDPTCDNIFVFPLLCSCNELY